MPTQPIVSIVYTPSTTHNDPAVLLVPLIDPDNLSDYGSQPLAIESGKHDYFADLAPFVRQAFPDFIETGRIQIGAEVAAANPPKSEIAIAPPPNAHPYAGTVYEVLPPIAIEDWPGGLSCVAKEHHRLAIDAAMNLSNNSRSILESWSKIWGLPAGTKSSITRALKSL